MSAKDKLTKESMSTSRATRPLGPRLPPSPPEGCSHTPGLVSHPRTYLRRQEIGGVELHYEREILNPCVFVWQGLLRCEHDISVHEVKLRRIECNVRVSHRDERKFCAN